MNKLHRCDEDEVTEVLINAHEADEKDEKDEDDMSALKLRWRYMNLAHMKIHSTNLNTWSQRCYDYRDQDAVSQQDNCADVMKLMCTANT